MKNLIHIYKKYKKSLLILIAFLGIGQELNGATFYVNGSTGNNSNIGTSTSAPVLTITYAVSKAVSGDIIVIASGSYTGQSISISKNLTFDINGQTVTIKSLRMSTSGVTLNIKGSTSLGELYVKDTFELTAGIIKVNGTIKPNLKILNSAKHIGGSINSFVDGGYWIGSTNNSSMTWAVGSGSNFRPISANSFTKIGTSVEYYFAEVLSGGPSFSVSLPSATRNISKVCHYYLTTTATTSIASSYVLKFSYDSVNNDDHVYDNSNLQLLTSSGVAAWTLNTSGSTSNRLGTITSAAITNLKGYYVLGNKSGSASPAYIGGLNTLGSSDAFAGYKMVGGCEGDTIFFYSISKSIGSSISTYTWDFGDGSPVKYGASAWHVYLRTVPAPFSYNYVVSLQTENATYIDKAYNNVVIGNMPRMPLNPNIYTQSADLLPSTVFVVCEGQTTRITDTYTPPSGEMMSKKIWTIKTVLPLFDRGGVAPYLGYRDSTKINYKFSTAGTYKIYITRTNSFGCTAKDSVDYILHAKPKVSIGTTNQCWEMVLTNNTLDPKPDKILNWQWDLGDGTKFNGQTTPLLNKVVKHKYAMSGAKQIKLYVTTDANCRDSIDTTILAKPTTAIDAIDQCWGLNKSVAISNTTIDPTPDKIVSWKWDLGDGTKLNGQTNPLVNKVVFHKYAKPGVKQIKLIITTGLNCKDSTTKMVKLFDAPNAQFNLKQDCENTLTINNSSINSPEAVQYYIWNWGDGSIPDSIYPNSYHKYSKLGIYKVILEVQSFNHCIDTQSVWYKFDFKRNKILLQPQNKSANLNDNVKFYITTSDSLSTYTWQMDAGLGFQNLTNAGQFNDVNNDTLTVSYISMINNNQYYRCLVKSGSCFDTSQNAKLIVLNNTGSESYPQLSRISIRPNPVESFLVISSDSKITNSHFEIFSIHGKSLMKGSLNEENTKLNLENLSSGIYYLKIGETRNTIKIIKK
jgi:hypothetical protein